MHKIDVIRAWKDPDYRESLSEAERATLPVNPVGEIANELSDEELLDIVGAGTPGILSIIIGVSAVSEMACPSDYKGICSAALCPDTQYGCPETSLPNSGCLNITYGGTKSCPTPFPPRPAPVPQPAKPK